MNYQDYAAEISKKYIRNHEESERILKHLFKQISLDLSQGKRIYFRGFGSFKKVRRPARKHYNFITKKVAVRPAKNDIEFTPGKKLLKMITR